MIHQCTGFSITLRALIDNNRSKDGEADALVKALKERDVVFLDERFAFKSPTFGRFQMLKPETFLQGSVEILENFKEYLQADVDERDRHRYTLDSKVIFLPFFEDINVDRGLQSEQNLQEIEQIAANLNLTGASLTSHFRAMYEFF